MAHKRSLSDIKVEESGVELDFAVQNLSQIKESTSGTKYYHGLAIDESGKNRFVGFDHTSQQKIAEMVQQNTPVRATNCAIKRSRSNENLEIHIKKFTTIAPSPKKIKFQDVSIDSIKDIPDGTTVNVTAKIVSLGRVQSVGSGQVQDVMITDDTGTIHVPLSLWDDNLFDKLETSKTYSFFSLFVRTFQNRKVLDFRQQKSSYILISNDFELDATTEEKVMCFITNAIIIGTQNCQFHYSCVNCENNMEYNGDRFIRCSKCGVFQETKSCRLESSGRILFQSESEKIFLFTDDLMKLLRDITVADDDWEDVDISQAQESLLSMTHKFNITYTTNKHHIQSIVKV